MVDTAVMLGAPEKAAQTQMEKALAFETKLAHVKTSRQINIIWLLMYGDDLIGALELIKTPALLTMRCMKLIHQLSPAV